MSAEFEAFAKALERSSERDKQLESPMFNQVTVLGGGPEGRLLAALCLSQNRSVTLFSAYGAELNALRAAGGITLRGDGPVGTFQVDLDSSPSIKTTAELDSAVSSADLIFLTGPVHKHRTYAMVLAEHLSDGQTLVIAPARTFAALEVSALLKIGGCRADITVVEVQHLPYWTEVQGNGLDLAASATAAAATMPGNQVNTIHSLAEILPNLHPAPNALHSSLADGSGVIEAVGLMFGESAVAGASETLLPGAESLPSHNNFHSLLATPNCRSLVSAALNERRQVAGRFGVRNLPDDERWIEICAGSDSQIRFRPEVEDVAAVLRSAVAGSLIPLQSAGQLVDVSTPVTDSLITVAGALLGSDVSASGRRLETMGIRADNADEARKVLESLVLG